MGREEALTTTNNGSENDSKFKHKKIHKFSRKEMSKNENSIIDYYLTRKQNQELVIDVKVIRKTEVDMITNW